MRRSRMAWEDYRPYSPSHPDPSPAARGPDVARVLEEIQMAPVALHRVVDRPAVEPGPLVEVHLDVHLALPELQVQDLQSETRPSSKSFPESMPGSIRQSGDRRRKAALRTLRSSSGGCSPFNLDPLQIARSHNALHACFSDRIHVSLPF